MPVSSKEEQTRENCQLLFHLNFNSNFSVKFYYSKSCPSLLESVCKNMLLPTFMASDSTSCNDPSPCSQGFPECHSNCSYRAATLVSAARDGFGKANSTKHGVNKQTNTRKWKSFIFVQEKGQGDLAQRHFCTPVRPRRRPWSQAGSFQLCSRAPGASSLHRPACTSLAGLRGRSKGRSPLWKSRQLSEQRQLGRARQSQNPCRQGMISCTVTEPVGRAATHLICLLLKGNSSKIFLFNLRKKKKRVLRKKNKRCW